LLIKFDYQLQNNAPQGIQIFNGTTLKYTRNMNAATDMAVVGNEISAMRLAAAKVSLIREVWQKNRRFIPARSVLQN